MNKGKRQLARDLSNLSQDYLCGNLTWKEYQEKVNEIQVQIKAIKEWTQIDETTLMRSNSKFEVVMTVCKDNSAFVTVFNRKVRDSDKAVIISEHKASVEKAKELAHEYV